MVENWNKKRKIPKEKRVYNPFAPTHTPLPIRLKNPTPQDSSLEAKAIKVIKDGTFNIPKHFSENMEFLTEKAKAYILEKYPLKEAAKVLSNLKRAEIIPFQAYSGKFEALNGQFQTTQLKYETEMPPSNSGMTNIFFEKPLNEEQVKKLPIEEERLQRYYQLGGGDNDGPGLRKVYINQIEKLLKANSIIYDRQTLNDHRDKLIIVQLPKERTIIVLTSISQCATRDTGQLSILKFDFASDKSSQEFVDFLQKYNCVGLNAVYLLILSNQLTPNIQEADREKVFYTVDAKNKGILLTKASIKEYTIEKGFSVKRLQPFKD